MPKLPFSKLSRIIAEESGALQPRLLLINGMLGLLPRYVAARLRPRILRLAGLPIGDGTIIMGPLRLHGYGPISKRLRIGRNCVINTDCFFDLNDCITIADHVGIGHEVMILTASHEMGQAAHRAGPLTTAPVTIESGAWIGARALILPGVQIGAGSVVAAGSVVTRTVPANTLVGGVPARPIRQLD
ncbi:acyltransferase [Chloroflexus sp.]|uniref:acyltransferase n=1 Tax=Chloroflexus sp. TaxID=1904827 RepID=UPI002618C887|nr:DapH/DapD/GlmU-related protein [uncultured Chloroflexus sp.]